MSTPATAQFLLTVPKIELGISVAQDPTDVDTTLVIFSLLTVLSLTPSILILMTSFTHIVIVLSFVRNALGTNQMPPNQVLIGLALFLTFYVMSPVFSVAYNEGISPYLDGDIPVEDALEKVLLPLRDFMFSQTREKDLELFLHMQGHELPQAPSDVGTLTLIPAFIISELKTASSLVSASLSLSLQSI